jgi:hypothetical protein
MRPRWAAALGALVLAASGCAAQPSAGPAPSGDALVQGPSPTGLGGFGALSATPVGDVIVPQCRPRSGAPYQIGAVGTFGGGSVKITDTVSVSGISGSFCAVATVVAAPQDTHPNAKVCAKLVAPKDGLRFDRVGTEISIIPGVTSRIGQVDVTPEAFSAFICDDGVPGELRLDTVIRASAVPELFGTRCEVGPLAATVTGAFTGPLSGASATLTSEPFRVAAVQPAPPVCPQALADSTNEILGLPLDASAAGLTITTVAQLYLAPYEPPA